MDIKGNRSTAGTLSLRWKSSAACHVHSLSHILTHSHTHVDNRTCNVNLTAEESRPIITEQWWESHNHKDSNRNLNQQMIPDCFAPSVYTRQFWFTFITGKPIVLYANVNNNSLIEPSRSLQVVICQLCFWVFAPTQQPHQMCFSVSCQTIERAVWRPFDSYHTL